MNARAKPDDISVLVVEPQELRLRRRPATDGAGRPATAAPSAPDAGRMAPIRLGGSWLSPGGPPGCRWTPDSPLPDRRGRPPHRRRHLQGAWWAVQGELPAGRRRAPSTSAGCWRLQPGVPVCSVARRPGNFRYPPSPLVSRRHVALTLLEGGTRASVEDLNSTNGTEILAG